jgi:GT2 family glycosyltransferase
VALIQRFDEAGSTPITASEIKHRWIEFHRQVRLMSGTRLQRTAGRILGEDTARYKVARFIFRPWLRALRALRGADDKRRATKLIAQRDDTVFPVNYRPRVVDYSAEAAALDVDLADVEIAAIERGRPLDETVAALNEALNTSTAEWLLVVDESIGEDARRVSAAALVAGAAPEVDVVYADEDGPHRFAPLLKPPAVGPHTLLSYDVVGRPALLRIESAFAAGGFRAEAGVAFEHDLYLRLHEAGRVFRHVPRVLPAGRPAAAFDDERLGEDTAAVVREALERRAMKGAVSADKLGGLVHWTLAAPDPAPRIDVIIPTRDRVDLLTRCLASIEEITTYPNYGVIILDNDSERAETRAFFESTSYRVVPCPGPFNYAKIVNRGIAHSSADYVVTLNNDTVVVTPDWLERLIALASLPDAGIVGACLLDQDGRREHEGIIIAPYPQHLRTDSNYAHVDYYSRATKDVAAVTGAVQMVERALWEHLGGMDEDLTVVMNDIDICLRALLEGRYTIYTPDVRLYHHVGSSRGRLDPLENRNRFIRRWDIFGSFRDPFFPESIVLLGEKMFYLPRSPGGGGTPL